MGVCSVIQTLKEKICEKGKKLAEVYKQGQLKKEMSVLYEEADGVYTKLQG